MALKTQKCNLTFLGLLDLYIHMVLYALRGGRYRISKTFILTISKMHVTFFSPPLRWRGSPNSIFIIHQDPSEQQTFACMCSRAARHFRAFSSRPGPTEIDMCVHLALDQCSLHGCSKQGAQRDMGIHRPCANATCPHT